MDTEYIGSEYRAGTVIATAYHTLTPIEQVRLFREVAKESDWCIQGFMDGVTD